jgi:thiamine biosynthesis lipoprotein
MANELHFSLPFGKVLLWYSHKIGGFIMKRLIVFLIIVVIALLSSCSPRDGSIQEQMYEKSFFAMDTFILLRVYSSDKGLAQKALDEAQKKIEVVEQLMSVHLDNSEVTEINRMAGVHGVKVDQKTLEVIERGKEFGRITKGIFDITIGSLTKLWSINPSNQVIPTEKEINESLELVDYNRIRINGNEIFLEDSGARLDLGGIAKGFGADLAAKVIVDNGIGRAMVNLGGDIVTIGRRSEERDWRIGIQHPRKRGELIGVVEVSGLAVVSSGDYERYFEKDGIRYHHIIDPRIGYPAQSDLISVTIVSESAMDSDAYSTAVFIMGSKEGLELIEGMDGVEGVLITRDLKFYVSSGLRGKVEINEGELIGD